MIQSQYITCFFLFITTCLSNLHAQGLQQLKYSRDGNFCFHEAADNNGIYYKFEDLPIVSYLVNGKLKSTSTGKTVQQADSIIITDGNLQISYKAVPFENGIKAIVIFPSGIELVVCRRRSA